MKRVLRKFINILNLLSAISIFLNPKKLRLLKSIKNSSRVVLENKILDNSFFYEPIRNSYEDLIGESCLKKMKDNDCYSLNLLERKDKKSLVFIDIGAHIGIFARVIKNKFPDAEIHCIEPDKDNFRLLSLNNQILENTFSYNYGIYKEDSEQTLCVSNLYSWRSTLKTNKNYFRKELIDKDKFNYDQYQIKCLSMDTFIKINSLKEIDFIGIDVPGEITSSVVKGAMPYLKKTNANLSIYIYPSEMEQVTKMLNQCQYKLVKNIFEFHTFIKVK